MPVPRSITFDAFPDSAFRHLGYDAIVCVDIIRATTTLVTAAAQGRRAFPVATLEDAVALAGRLSNPVLAGERNGDRPFRFEMQNSPAELARRRDVERPLVLLSSIGTELIVNSGGCANVYVTSFQNLSATADALASNHRRIAVLAACSRGQMRCEDEMGSAWLLERLMLHGFEPENPRTADLVRRWGGADVTLVRLSNSAEYLRRTGQNEDLEFVVEHIDDLDLVCRYEDGEIVAVTDREPAGLRRASASEGGGRSLPRRPDVDNVVPLHAARATRAAAKL